MAEIAQLQNKRNSRKLGPLQRLSLAIIGSLEKFFYNWGYNIAIHPWKFIAACIFFTVCCSTGLLGFTMENRPDKLWIPWNSEFSRDTDWLRENFPSPIRFHYAIITADNVLTPSIMKMLMQIHKNVSNINVQGRGWKDICFKLPVTKFMAERRRRHVSKENVTVNDNTFLDFDDLDEDEQGGVESVNGSVSKYDPSIELPSAVYCEILNVLDEACYESNMVELWNFDENLTATLNEEDILNSVNSQPSVSPVFGRPVNYSSELSGVVRNETDGQIVAAKAVLLRWFAHINQTALKEGKMKEDLGTGESVDEINLLWEKEFISVLKSFPLPSGVKMYFNAARSFGDISGATIMNDAGMLAVGFSIVFVYVIFMLGRCNMIEQRPFVSLAGLSCVGLAIGVSYGICSIFHLIYGPVHNVLPFLLMGIGIDDMFVIVQSWNNLTPVETKRPLPERMGLTMKHAGVSITVTSVTDFVAFAIGGSTVLPALQSFCIYAAVGIIATYIFQATFFVAWFALDQRRVEDKRNAYLVCYKYHRQYKPNDCSQTNYAQNFFARIYADFLFHKATKVIVFLTTASFLGVNIWANTQLRQEFNPIWFLPTDSYLFKYFEARDAHFPGRGDEGFVIIQNISIPENMRTIDNIVFNLEHSQSIYDADTWYSEFKIYVNKNFKKDIPNNSLSDSMFRKYLGKFLFSPSGAKYRSKFKFDGNLTCGEKAPNIKLFSLGFKFKTFNGPKEHIPAMHEIKKFVHDANFTSEAYRSFVWSFAFAGWETDEIITAELYRNMALAMMCVMVTTLLLIANFPMCIMVLTCVTLTLVGVGGGMYFWNLTVDTVSCIDLVLAIGLCVDYAAHIGHAFMTCVGTREERAREALRIIGPAVLNGGVSTFLAFVLLANSKSHVFITFFKVFFLVIVFGLYHGLVFLPVLLSVIGPNQYPTVVEIPLGNNEATMELNPVKNPISPTTPNHAQNDDFISDRLSCYDGKS